NRVLVTKPHNKTPYELLLGRTPSIGFMRPFGCLVTIINTLDPLGKFDGKADEGFLVGYSVSRSVPTWLFDIDTHTKSMNYQPVTAGNQPTLVQVSKNILMQIKQGREMFSNIAVGPSNTADSPTLRKSSYVDPSQYLDDPNMPALEDITYSDDEENVGAEADFSNLETSITDEGIDYDEVFAPVARIKDIQLFLGYVSFMGFMVYQIDVKSAFLYRNIKEEKQDGIFISQDKYVAKILRKFGLTDRKSASTPIDTEKPLLKDPDGEDVDVHTYRLTMQVKKSSME
nr:ribonuclease H-like domain-containing protein [Tanacetum cinerariifolium]